MSIYLVISGALGQSSGFSVKLEGFLKAESKWGHIMEESILISGPTVYYHVEQRLPKDIFNLSPGPKFTKIASMIAKTSAFIKYC